MLIESPWLDCTFDKVTKTKDGWRVDVTFPEKRWFFGIYKRPAFQTWFRIFGGIWYSANGMMVFNSHHEIQLHGAVLKHTWETEKEVE